MAHFYKTTWHYIFHKAHHNDVIKKKSKHVYLQRDARTTFFPNLDFVKLSIRYA